MPPVAARPAAALGLVLLLAAATACGSAPQPGPAGPAAAPGAPAPAVTDGASPFWVDPGSEAARQVTAWEATGRYDDAQVLRRIAERPVALWG
ncbi:glycoside hydrolase family 6 protein, partial [Streptomyces yangpuensis]